MWRIDAIAPVSVVAASAQTLAQALGNPAEAASFIFPLARTSDGARAWGNSGVLTQEQRDALEAASWPDVMWTVRAADTDVLLAASIPVAPEVVREGWTWDRTMEMFGYAPVFED